jgi:hypothetical protein
MPGRPQVDDAVLSVIAGSNWALSESWLTNARRASGKAA